MNLNESKIGILLVVTNEERFLQSFLLSLQRQTYSNYALYILDNNCFDSSIEIIRTFFPISDITHVDENVGFAKGNNILAEKAISYGCRYLFILNPDIELDKNCLLELKNLIESEKNIAAVAPIMFYGFEKRSQYKIQSYADHINFKKREVKSLQGNEIYEEHHYPEEIDVNVVSGGITFIKANVVQEIGLFDERYFIYGEEADLALRSYRAGYKMKVTSRAKVWHHHDWSPQNRKKHYFSYYYMNRSKVLYLIKFNFWGTLILLLIKEISFFPFRARWLRKIADNKLIRYYYIGLLHGLINRKGVSSVRFE